MKKLAQIKTSESNYLSQSIKNTKRVREIIDTVKER